MTVRRSSGCRRGHAAVEMAFLAPWIIFLFVGASNVGFYLNALIATANAARVAALYTSANPASSEDSGGACLYALGELKTMPNTRNLTTCTAPLTVTATLVNDAYGQPASEVTVQYQTPPLIPIPGVLSSRATITRRARMKI